jgi:6-phosphogluconolactonase
VAVNPTSKFVYVTNQTSNNISAYSIGRDGTLTSIPGSPFAAGIEPVSVGVDPNNKFACVANKFSHNVSVYRIGEDGGLSPVAGSPFPAGAGPNSVALK